ncbi:MAG: rRNA pseudouridine synthase [Planctomycetia bacterium]|nr:rRNA pseudouridine synthase [Planctomycetia bacterium]
MSFDNKKPSRNPRSLQRGPYKKPQRRKRSSGARSEGDVADGIRLQKVMAAAGIGSRRHCEELIEAGRVQIDGSTAKIGAKIDPAKNVVRVDGEIVKASAEPVYYLVNKPEGVVSTNNDPSGRPRVIDLVPITDREHLFTVGRLDLSSEGLILVTNDGELANQLTHPRYGVDKTYLALVAGQPDQSVYQKLRQGVHLAEGTARCVSVYVKRALPQSTLLEIVLNEGKNREIRRILAKVGHKVLKLKRSAIGDVTLHGLKPGEYRKPTREELKSLREAMHNKKVPRPIKPAAEQNEDDEDKLTAGPIVVSPAKPNGRSSPRPDADEDAQPKRPYSPRPEAVRVTGIRPDKRAVEGAGGKKTSGAAGKQNDGQRSKPASKGKFEKRPFSAPPTTSRREDGGGAGRRDRGNRAAASGAPAKKPFGKKFAAGRPAKTRPEGNRDSGYSTEATPRPTSDAGFPGKKRSKPAFDDHKKKKGPPPKGFGTIIGD